MKIGELFVNLGVKGAEKTGQALGAAKEGLKGLMSASLETKAALVATFYALEQLTAGTIKQGTVLTQFADRTGLSVDFLQRWQYLMRQNKVSAEETMQSIEGLQNAIAAYASGVGPAPRFLTVLQNQLGAKFDISRARDIPYLLNAIREVAKLTAKANGGIIPEDIRNQIFGGSGLSPNFIATLSKSAIDINKIKRSELFSERETGALHQMNVEFANLGNQIEKAIGRFTIRFGPTFVKGFKEIVPEIIKAANAIANLIDKLHVMQGLARVFHVLAEGINMFTKGAQILQKEGFTNLIPSAETLKFLGKDLLSQGLTAAQTGAKSVVNTFNTTINATLEGAAELGEEVGKEIAKQIQTAVRQQPQAGAAGGF